METKEMETLREITRKVEREAESAFQRRDAWRLRHLRELLTGYGARLILCQMRKEERGETEEAAKTKMAISSFAALERHVDTLLAMLDNSAEEGVGLEERK